MSSTKNKLLYVIPGFSFFSEGYRGRVMHALGVCEGFSNLGVEVTIIGGDNLTDFKDDIPDGVSLIELVEPKGIFKYFRWQRLLWQTIYAQNKNIDFDVIILRYAASMSVFLALMGKFLPTTITKVLEVNSFFYHWVRQRPKLISTLVSHIEAFVVRRYDVLYLVSNSMLRDARIEKFWPAKVVIPNGATTTQLNRSLYFSEVTKPRIVYFGTLMPYWDLDFVAQVITKSQGLIDTDFIFIGDGAGKEDLMRKVEQFPNVKFYGRFDRKSLSNYIKTGDILWYPPKTREDKLLTGGLSTKMFEYMSLSMPILCPMDGEITDVFRDRENAIFYDSSNPNSFLQSVGVCLADSDLRNKIAHQAHLDFREKYSWSARMLALSDFIESEDL